MTLSRMTRLTPREITEIGKAYLLKTMKADAFDVIRADWNQDGDGVWTVLFVLREPGFVVDGPGFLLIDDDTGQVVESI